MSIISVPSYLNFNKDDIYCTECKSSILKIPTQIDKLIHECTTCRSGWLNGTCDCEYTKKDAMIYKCNTCLFPKCTFCNNYYQIYPNTYKKPNDNICNNCTHNIKK
jgi:hypothetical protein